MGGRGGGGGGEGGGGCAGGGKGDGGGAHRTPCGRAKGRGGGGGGEAAGSRTFLTFILQTASKAVAGTACLMGSRCRMQRVRPRGRVKIWYSYPVHHFSPRHCSWQAASLASQVTSLGRAARVRPPVLTLTQDPPARPAGAINEVRDIAGIVRFGHSIAEIGKSRRCPPAVMTMSGGGGGDDGGGGRDGGGTEGGDCGGAVGGAEDTDTATATAVFGPTCVRFISLRAGRDAFQFT